MRIAFLTRSIHGGGAERQLMLLARGLAARGHDVYVLSFYDESATTDGVRVVGLGKRGRWHAASFFMALVAALRDIRPDILHGYLPVANVLAAAARPLLPPTALVFGVRATTMELARYDRLSRLSYRLEALLARSADLIVCNSTPARDQVLGRGYPRDRTAAIHNGIDTAAFKPDAEAGRRVRAAFGFSASDVVIGHAARLDPMKDQATLLEALARLADGRPALRGVIVGDGPARAGLESQARAAGLADRIVWAGHRADMAAVYNAFDVMCLSSAFGESFPNAVGEALACAVPCVATELGDVRLLIGDGGSVVPPRDAAALAAALAAIVDAPAASRAALGRRGRDRVETLFSAARMVEKTEAALAAIVCSPA